MHYSLEKIYCLGLHARRNYELRTDDLSLSALSFLRLADSQTNEKEVLGRIIKDLESVLKLYAEKTTKIKSRIS